MPRTTTLPRPADRPAPLHPSMAWALFDRSTVAAAECDTAGVILRANAAFAELLGYGAEELVGLRVLDLTLPEDQAHSREQIGPILAGAVRETRYAKRYRRKDGGVVWAVISLTHIADAGGRPSIIGQVLDVTALKESERALSESNALAWALFERSPVAAALNGADGRIQRVNQALLDLTGYAREELIGRLPTEFTHPEDLPTTRAQLARMMNGESLRYEKRYLHKRGHPVWISLHANAITLPDGGRGALVFLVDITESRRLQQEMQVLAERWKLAAAGAGIGVWDLDLRTGALVWDDTMRQIYDLAPEDPPLDLRRWLARVEPEDRERVAALVDERRKATVASEFHAEFRIRRRDGALRWVRSVGVGHRDASGLPYRAVGINKDITEERETAQRLAQVSARLELANEAAGIGVWESEPGGASTWDSQVRRLWGLGADEPCSHELRIRRVHEADRARVASHWREALKPGGPQLTELQFRIDRPDGEVHWLHSVARFLRAADGRVERVLGAEWDVSAQQFATEQVREQSAALKDAQRVARVSSWRLEVATGHVTWSDEAYALFGREPGTAVPSLLDHEGFYAPESWARLMAAMDRMLVDGAPVEEMATLMLPRGEVYVHLRAAVRRGEDGRVVAIVGTLQDVTSETLRGRQVEELSRLPAENPHPILRYAIGGELKFANRRAQAYLAALATESPERQAQWQARVMEAMRSPLSSFEFEVTGQIAQFDCRVVAEHGYANFYGRDVTTERVQQRRLQLQATAMNAASNVMFICDRDGRIQWVNRAFTEITGYAAEEAVGQSPRLLKSGKQTPEWSRSMWQRILAGEVWRGHLTNRRKSGDLYEVDQTVTPIRDDSGAVTHFVAVHEDITERMRTEKKMVQLAMFDSVTGLPNRNMFQRHAAEAIARTARGGLPFALMLLDLDHFKTLNDTLGHAAGDELLLQVARRLAGGLGAADLVARLGGDEFAVLIERVEKPQDAADAAQRLLDVFREPFKVRGNDFTVRGSVGVAMYRDAGDTADTLIKQADLAMYAAKGRGRGGYQFFDAAMDAMARLRFTTEAALHEAMRADRLALAFQPQFDLVSRRPIGSEALLRWNHPERGYIPPQEFVALAEQCGMIFELDDWVLRKAFSQAAAWKTARPELLPLAVNVSASHFDRSGLAARIESLLAEFALAPGDIELEITESVMMRHSSTVEDNVQALARAGVALTVDDFGTGYSSLLSLRDFPVHRLKIDGSFVQGIGVNPKDEQIVRAIITLGASLRVKVIAEGVETEAQAGFLAGAGCSAAQGFLFGRPMFADDLDAAIGALADRRRA